MDTGLLYEPITNADDANDDLEREQSIIYADGECEEGEGGEDEEELGQSEPTSSVEYDEDFENLVMLLMKDRDRINVNQAALNIAYTIINAGLIALPFTAYHAGIPLYIAIVLTMSVISCYVAVMVIAMANEKRVRTLEDLAEVVGGPKFFLLVCGFQILFSFSMMSITLNVWADVMSDLFARNSLDFYLLSTRRGQVLIGSALILPLCLFKHSMISLRWTAYLTVTAVSCCLIAVVLAYFFKEGVGTTVQDVMQPKSEWWTVMYVIVFCYSYNQRVFAVYRCLSSHKTQSRMHRWKKAVARAGTGVTTLYILFGVSGYLSMARKGIDVNNFNYFLDNQGEDVILYDIARVVVVSSLLLTIPVDCLIASTTWRRLYRRYLLMTYELNDTKVDDTERDDIPQPQQQHQPKEEENFLSTNGTVERTTNSQDMPARDNIGSVATSHDAVDILTENQRRSSQSMSIEREVGLRNSANSNSNSNNINNTGTATTGGAVPVNVGSSSGGGEAHTGSISVTANNASSSNNSNGERAQSTATTCASSVTTVPHRIPSKDEMASILRANSLEQATKQDSEHIGSGGLNNSWLSNYSFDPFEDHSNSLRRGGKGTTGGHQLQRQDRFALRSDSYGGYLYRGAPSFPAADDEALRGPCFYLTHGRGTPLLLWALCVLTSFAVDHWMYLAASIGTFSTTMLVFIFPTMFYFRMTLKTDYQAIPLPVCGLLPNRAYMSTIQLLGIAILLCDVLAVVYFPATGAHIIRNQT
mmetsp:Transcript_3139/g.4900  ORF Transcript_3139/g.4900 Transcript_3139/m.4900 type:complete len:757 (-) Transcript_3139:295-2565(-)|eukprot:CAMPEP_0174960618 /NCGR_PEP_ID=MMETSP0004_2-20121128/3798_1 /TAXON_ID=420556 /ORGANISM="Ochromonas sp., Strain CCMP1393" /LENGTH=756 /DNA_ID=CAMNT_0016208999 /DNA_START=177 /DNA_END=2447 /DNA_ORIENTATION=+